MLFIFQLSTANAQNYDPYASQGTVIQTSSSTISFEPRHELFHDKNDHTVYFHCPTTCGYCNYHKQAYLAQILLELQQHKSQLQDAFTIIQTLYQQAEFTQEQVEEFALLQVRIAALVEPINAYHRENEGLKAIIRGLEEGIRVRDDSSNQHKQSQDAEIARLEKQVAILLQQIKRDSEARSSLEQQLKAAADENAELKGHLARFKKLAGENEKSKEAKLHLERTIRELTEELSEAKQTHDQEKRAVLLEFQKENRRLSSRLKAAEDPEDTVESTPPAAALAVAKSAQNPNPKAKKTTKGSRNNKAADDALIERMAADSKKEKEKEKKKEKEMVTVTAPKPEVIEPRFSFQEIEWPEETMLPHETIEFIIELINASGMNLPELFNLDTSQKKLLSFNNECQYHVCDVMRTKKFPTLHALIKFFPHLAGCKAHPITQLKEIKFYNLSALRAQIKSNQKNYWLAFENKTRLTKAEVALIEHHYNTLKKELSINDLDERLSRYATMLVNFPGLERSHITPLIQALINGLLDLDPVVAAMRAMYQNPFVGTLKLTIQDTQSYIGVDEYLNQMLDRLRNTNEVLNEIGGPKDQIFQTSECPFMPPKLDDLLKMFPDFARALEKDQTLNKQLQRVDQQKLVACEVKNFSPHHSFFKELRLKIKSIIDNVHVFHAHNDVNWKEHTTQLEIHLIAAYMKFDNQKLRDEYVMRVINAYMNLTFITGDFHLKIYEAIRDGHFGNEHPAVKAICEFSPQSTAFLQEFMQMRQEHAAAAL